MKASAARLEIQRCQLRGHLTVSAMLRADVLRLPQDVRGHGLGLLLRLDALWLVQGVVSARGEVFSVEDMRESVEIGRALDDLLRAYGIVEVR